MSDRKHRAAHDYRERRRSCTGGANLVRLSQPTHRRDNRSGDRPLSRAAKVAILAAAIAMTLVFLAAAFATATGLIQPTGRGALPADRPISVSELNPS